MGARNRVGMDRVVVPAHHHATQPVGIGSLESIIGLLKSLKFGLWIQLIKTRQILGRSKHFLLTV
jgi:hypothetical protein